MQLWIVIIAIAFLINSLQTGVTLENRYRNHQLIGNWFPCWECHLEPDWLLIYKLDKALEVR